MKQCRICKRYKASSSFNKHNHAKDGLDGRCKICYRIYKKSNYIKTRELRYEFSNCRFISCAENVRKGRMEFELEKSMCKAAVEAVGIKEK